MSLDILQSEAVESNSPFKVVIAGPGSGKTRTLVASVQRDINSGVDPKAIVVLTFTNTAAREFNQRLGVEVGYSGTRHGFVFRLLQEHGHHIGFKKGGVSLITPEEYQMLLLETSKRLGYKHSIKTLLDMKGRREIQNIYKEAEFQMRRNNSVDYDFLLEMGVVLLRNFAVRDALKKYQRYYVDECQDNSRVDWSIDLEIPVERKFFVGDVDQSIYGFRGARPEELLAMAERPKIDRFLLDFNYRSEPTICKAANDMIQNNRDRVDHRMIPIRTKDRGYLTIHSGVSDYDEKVHVYELIEKYVAEGASYSDIAILARTNRYVEDIKSMLKLRGIPVFAYERPELPKDWSLALAVLSLAINPDNDLVAETVLKHHGYNKVYISFMKGEAASAGKSLIRTAELPFMDWIEECSVDQYFNFSRLLSRNKVKPDTLNLIEERADVLSNPTLPDLLRDLWKPEDWNEGESRAGVTVGTIHQAKAREWKHVIVSGLMEGILPLKNSGIEEERRLAFVAITRAKDTLDLTYHTRMIDPYTSTVEEMIPSRFIEEMTGSMKVVGESVRTAYLQE